MNNESWQLKVENQLGVIVTEIRNLKDMMPKDENKSLNSKIKLNRWLIGGLFLSIITLLGIIK